MESVLLEPEPGRPHNAEGWTYTTYIIVSLSLTLGVAVLAFILVVSTIVVIKKLRIRGQKVEPPVLSEKEMLAAMKKTGYVNPTYKFYVQS